MALEASEVVALAERARGGSRSQGNFFDWTKTWEMTAVISSSIDVGVGGGACNTANLAW
jgi:hypothetical protein